MWDMFKKAIERRGKELGQRHIPLVINGRIFKDDKIKSINPADPSGSDLPNASKVTNQDVEDAF